MTPMRKLHAFLMQRYAAASFTWGFLEAMLFFLVPDVVLTVIAVTHLRRSLLACLWAVGGGMLGGSLMYAWGAHDAATAMAAIDAVPAIPLDMIATVQREMGAKGLSPMLWGPVVGIPYKIYATQAGVLHLPWPAFVLMTIPARIIRFLVACVAFNLVARLVRRYMGTKAVPWCWGLFWVLNYTIYWHATMRP